MKTTTHTEVQQAGTADPCFTLVLVDSKQVYFNQEQLQPDKTHTLTFKASVQTTSDPEELKFFLLADSEKLAAFPALVETQASTGRTMFYAEARCMKYAGRRWFGRVNFTPVGNETYLLTATVFETVSKLKQAKPAAISTLGNLAEQLELDL